MQPRNAKKSTLHEVRTLVDTYDEHVESIKSTVILKARQKPKEPQSRGKTPVTKGPAEGRSRAETLPPRIGLWFTFTFH